MGGLLDSGASVGSTCANVEATLEEDAELQNALECDFMNYGTPQESICSNVLVRCSVGAANNTGCRIGLSVQVRGCGGGVAVGGPRFASVQFLE
jgi:hypothetical protein